MKSKEKVLCIKRSALPEQWVGKKSIIKTEESLFYGICAKAGFKFLERGIIETAPSFKQIIPYIILRTVDGTRTVIYKRQGSEERLHDLWSVGIGGHINPVDNWDYSDSFQAILTTGMNRELDEELSTRPEGLIPTFQGTINEELTDVGSVHLGAVFTILTREPEAFKPGEELVGFKWVETSTLHRYTMELWSELALELIA